MNEPFLGGEPPPQEPQEPQDQPHEANGSTNGDAEGGAGGSGPATPKPTVLVIPPGSQVVAVVVPPGQEPQLTVNVDGLPTAFTLLKYVELNLTEAWLMESQKVRHERATRKVVAVPANALHRQPGRHPRR